jgi:hypothetical protein
MTQSEFDRIARAAVKVVSLIEGWDAEHPSWVVRDGKVRASKAFRVQLLKELEEHGIHVMASRD